MARNKKIVVFWTLNEPRYWSGECGGWRRSRIEIFVNLKRNWLKARREARKFHLDRHEAFMNEFIDTVLHEYAHAFGPSNLVYVKAERMARQFAMYGTWTRR